MRGRGGHVIGCDVSVSPATVGTILSSLPQLVSEGIAQIPLSPVTCPNTGISSKRKLVRKHAGGLYIREGRGGEVRERQRMR